MFLAQRNKMKVIIMSLVIQKFAFVIDSSCQNWSHDQMQDEDRECWDMV